MCVHSRGEGCWVVVTVLVCSSGAHVTSSGVLEVELVSEMAVYPACYSNRFP